MSTRHARRSRAIGRGRRDDRSPRRRSTTGRSRPGVAAAVAAVAALAGLTAACTPPPTPDAPANPLSLGTGNVPGDGSVGGASISGSGAVVAFTSTASNLVPGDTNGVSDLFVRVTSSGALIRAAEQVNGEPRVSDDGRYVSYRANSGQRAVFDRLTSTPTSWTPSAVGFGPVVPIVSADGTAAIYGVQSSFGITSTACRVRTLATGEEQNCPAGGPGFGQLAFEAASPSGRFVLYYWLDQSGGGTSRRTLWDRTTGTTTTVPASIAFFPTFAVLADDGTIVFTEVLATGFGTLVAYDVTTGTLTSMPGPVPDGNTLPTGVADDGSAVTFVSQATNLAAGDTNGTVDSFRWEVGSGTVARTSLNVQTGAQLPNGANRCGSAPGQATGTGTSSCGLTVDPAVAIDTNGLTDAYRFG